VSTPFGVGALRRGRGGAGGGKDHTEVVKGDEEKWMAW